MKKDVRCLVCRSEFSRKELQNNMSCPVCGYQGLVMLTSGDVSININWFELKLICMWAESLVLQTGGSETIKVFYSIIKELAKQVPNEKITVFNKSSDFSMLQNDLKVPEGTLLN